MYMCACAQAVLLCSSEIRVNPPSQTDLRRWNHLVKRDLFESVESCPITLFDMSVAHNLSYHLRRRVLSCTSNHMSCNRALKVGPVGVPWCAMRPNGRCVWL